MMLRPIQIIIACLFIPCIALAADGVHQFEVRTQSGLNKHSPVLLTLPEGFPATRHLILTSQSVTQPIACQSSEDGKHAIFLLPHSIAPEQSQSFNVTTTQKPFLPEVKVLQKAEQLSFLLGEKKVLEYHTSIVEPPDGFSKLYRRSGHIHPFVTPTGRVVTDGFPLDHMHQHAIFAAWTKTFFEGERVDFWNQKAGTGTVLHKEVLEMTSGPVFASAKVRLIHKVLKETPRPVLDELWTIRLYKISNAHIFDIESIQTCVADSPLTIAEYHYGGFAFRGSAEWEGKEAHKLITNETKDRKAGNHTRPDWVSIYGKVQGEDCGAAMFSHPQNFRSPQPVRLHPSMPYFVYSPCVLGEFDLKPGTSYKTRNRYIAFDGPPDTEFLNNLWSDYSQTPEIIWKEVK